MGNISVQGKSRDRAPELTVKYLVGELWRRIGDVATARIWFNKVADEIIDLQSQQWILDAARQQRDCPREWFG